MQNEIAQLGSIKVGVDIKMIFERQRMDNDGVEYTTNFFQENDPIIFTRDSTKTESENYFVRKFEYINEEMDIWVQDGSGWEINQIDLVYVNVARYAPLRVGSHFTLPPKLAKKSNN